MPDNDRKKNRLIKKAAKHKASLKSGGFGRKQGGQSVTGWILPSGEKVGASYTNSDGVKAKDIKDAKPQMSDAAPKGKLGGAVGVKEYTPTTPIPEKPIKSLSRKFKSKEDESISEEQGYSVSAKNPDSLESNVNSALEKTSIGKDITKSDKRFEEAPEFTSNEKVRAENKKNKYVKGSLTDEQKTANKKARQRAKNIGKEGSRKVFRYMKKEEYRKDK